MTADFRGARTGQALGIRFGPVARLHWLNAGLAATGFVVDAALERGVASGVFYVAVVALTAWSPGMRSTMGMGVAASALTVLGYFVSMPGGELWKAVVNRLFALFAIWVTVALVWHQKRLSARRDLAEARAARSELQFRQTIESSPTGMLLVDGLGQIALANLEADRLFGYLRGELVGQPVEIIVPELDRAAHARHRVAFAAEAKSRRMGDGREVTGVDKQGRTLSLEIGLARIESPDGQFVLATVADVSVRKQLERTRGARAMARILLEAEEAQRKRMSREIHDVLGQALTALKLDIGWLAAQLPEEPAHLHARAMEMEDLVSQTIVQVRRLSTELRPAILDDQGLLPAIRWHVGDFEKRSGLRLTLTLPDDEIPWGAERSSVVFRVLQEALTNVSRHAQARHVTVVIWRQQRDALLEVRDDGRGITDEEAAGPGALGMLGMRERALLHEGLLTVAGAEGIGTTVTLRMPVEPDRPPAGAATDPGPDTVALRTLVAEP